MLLIQYALNIRRCYYYRIWLFVSRLLFRNFNITRLSRRQRILAFTSFMTCLFLVPVFIFYLIFIFICRRIWLRILSGRYPELEFVENTSIRTLLDTLRNQGILNILMEIRGSCQPLQIRQALLDRIVDKKDRFGHYKYPRLRAGLVSRWGNYAWKVPIPFHIGNHLIVANSAYKGRYISDYNIQEYVSDITSKCFSANSSPWQVVIIPNVVCDVQKYYILIRVHHLLVDEDEPLNIKDFFFLKSSEEGDTSTPASVASSFTFNPDHTTSSLKDIVKPFKSLSKLFNMLNYNLLNKWNEFILKYDPVEQPKNMTPSTPGFFHCLAIILITIVKTYKEYHRVVAVYKSDSADNRMLFYAIFDNEFKKRNIDRQNIIRSLFLTFTLKNFIYGSCACVSAATSLFLYTIPTHLSREIVAFLSLNTDSSYPNTIVSTIHTYFPLLYKASLEFVYLSKIIYMAPISLLHELYFREDLNEYKKHQLQSESLCGRKVVAWSDPVPEKTIEELAEAAGASVTELMITMAKNCLLNYFESSECEVPDKLLLTARMATCELFTNSAGYSESEGLVYFSLPLPEKKKGDVLNELVIVKNELQLIKINQMALYLFSTKKELFLRLMPSIIAKIILNYWTRKFPVLLTEVVDNDENGVQETIWGHPLSSFISWKPPQGNVCMSMTMQRYAGNVRMCVMADARIHPHQSNAIIGWKETVEKLRTQLEESGRLQH